MKIVEQETNLEDLIVLGDDKKIPITIEFPNGENTIKAKALIKPLTLAELEKINIDQSNLLKSEIEILHSNLFKNNGDTFSKEELSVLPVGVVNNISENIMKISGINYDPKNLKDF